ncbi:hypothetical protein SmJEL517_g04443 [Synchytrium microbalum]|uniref:TRP C-terminal domain-containing protein n=1 Tax=Synchytrium microbalum TaxID=1806994 RepID=A0A507BZ74_9FUNG|nr:uncharacterized protein SmJEL517_g04443 [Synchytrium microbalum]TPX32408.1 hypothetical protein SmJEL517_g04443 [Synchytrium microbalum]
MELESSATGNAPANSPSQWFNSLKNNSGPPSYTTYSEQPSVTTAPGRGSRPTWRTPLGQFTLGWSATQMFLIIILEAIVLVIHGNEVNYVYNISYFQAPQVLNSIIPNENAVTLYHAIYLAAQIFQFLLALDAVISSSTIQLICTTVFNWVLTIYAVVQYWQSRTLASQAQSELAQSGVKATLHWSMVEEFVIIGLMIVFALGWIYLTIKLHRQFGWSIFKELGADVSTRGQLRMYHIFLMLLKVDVFFFNGFTIQYLVLVLVGNADQTTILFNAIFVTPITIPLLIMAYYAVRRESRILMCIFMVILVSGTGYVISRLADIYQTKDSNKYLASKSSLTLFESVTVILAIVTVVFAYLNMRQFGRGLQDQLRRRPQSKTASVDGRVKRTQSASSLAYSDAKYDSNGQRDSPPIPINNMYLGGQQQQSQLPPFPRFDDRGPGSRFPPGIQPYPGHVIQKPSPIQTPASSMMGRPQPESPRGVAQPLQPMQQPGVLPGVPITPPPRQYTQSQLAQASPLYAQHLSRK